MILRCTTKVLKRDLPAPGHPLPSLCVFAKAVDQELYGPLLHIPVTPLFINYAILMARSTGALLDRSGMLELSYYVNNLVDMLSRRRPWISSCCASGHSPLDGMTHNDDALGVYCRNMEPNDGRSGKRHVYTHVMTDTCFKTANS